MPEPGPLLSAVGVLDGGVLPPPPVLVGVGVAPRLDGATLPPGLLPAATIVGDIEGARLPSPDRASTSTGVGE